MLNPLLLASAFVALVTVVCIGVHTLFFCQSKKKNYFMLCVMAIGTLILGHILEQISVDADEAFTALRLLYTGSVFIGPFTLFFIADYCEVPLSRRFVRAPLIAAACALIAVEWTTDRHGLVYKDYWFDEQAIHYLDYNPGPLFPLFPVFALACSLCAIGFLVFRMKTWHSEKKKLRLLALCIVTPLAGELVYYLFALAWGTENRVYVTPFSLALMSVLLFIGIRRYDLFDVIPQATRLAMDSISEAYVLVDTRMHYVASNASARKLFPGLGKLPKWTPLPNLKGWPAQLADLSQLAGAKSVRFTLEDQGKRYFMASVNRVSTQSHTSGWMILIQDVTDAQELLQKLEDAANTDELTGINNRRSFMQLAEREYARAQRTGRPSYVLMCDIDWFKVVNDTYGHPAGDVALRGIAKTIGDSVRSYDVLGRYGGEEFVIMAVDLNPQTVFALAERIRKAIGATEFSYEGQSFSVTVSIGIAENTTADSLETQIKNADDAMYIAKNGGRNQTVMYNPADVRRRSLAEQPGAPALAPLSTESPRHAPLTQLRVAGGIASYDVRGSRPAN